MRARVAAAALCLLLAVLGATAETVERRRGGSVKTVLKEVQNEHVTRPTFIDSKVLEMLPDAQAAGLVVNDPKELESWTVPEGGVKDSIAMPSAAKLRFRELQRVVVKQKHKAKVHHKVHHKKAPPPPPLHEGPLYAQEKRLAEEQRWAEQRERFMIEQAQRLSGGEHLGARAMRFQEQFDQPDTDAQVPEMQDPQQLQQAQDQPQQLQQQQDQDSRSNVAERWNPSSSGPSNEQSLQPLPSPSDDQQQPEMIQSQAAPPTDDDMPETPAEQWMRDQQQRFKQVKEDAGRPSQIELEHYGYTQGAGADASSSAASHRFRQRGNLPDHVVEARIERARQRKVNNGRVFNIEAPPAMPGAMYTQLPQQQQQQQDSAAAAPAMVEEEATFTPHKEVMPVAPAMVEEEATFKRHGASVEQRISDANRDGGMRFREARRDLGFERRPSIADQVSGKADDDNLPEAPPMEPSPLYDEAPIRERRENGFHVESYTAPNRL